MSRPVIAVAVSGGRDSTALWHAVARAARGTALQVAALHVHHGLESEADAWAAHLQRQARRWAAAGMPVSLQWRRLQGAPAVGDSIEAWARRERYAALAEMARACGAQVVLLAHHREDQAETFLLQALRGAGPAGLAAMPREAQRGGIVWVRPWLEQPRRAIDAYVQRHQLRFVDDPSNERQSLARGRLRQQAWPALEAHFEQAAASLNASARRAHEAAEGLRELAALDAAQACNVDGALVVRAWSSLSDARRANLLRAWLHAQGPTGPPETLVQRLLHELPAAAPGAMWHWGPLALRLYRGRLQRGVVPPAKPPPQQTLLPIDLSRVGRHAVAAWAGAFEVFKVDGDGVQPQQLQTCEMRERSGGEQFQRSRRSMPRSLKKQFQAARVPAWQRNGPLLYVDGQLLYVPGLGIDARCLATSGAAGLGLRWLPDSCT